MATQSTYPPLPTTFMHLIKKDVVPWLNFAKAIRLKHRACWRQSLYKNHLRSNVPGATSVWLSRAYMEVR